jgi:drug/metabolite transporter (DMT)-like permease
VLVVHFDRMPTTVLILTIVVWWLVSIAQGDPSQPIGILAAIGGAVFIASAFVLQRRS